MKPFLIVVGVVLLTAILWLVTRKPSYEPSIQSTYVGDPFAYDGSKVLIVAVYAHWASVWKAATEPELAKLDLEKYDLRLISADNELELCKRLGTTIVPTVYVFRDAKVAESFPNLMRIDDLL